MYIGIMEKKMETTIIGFWSPRGSKYLVLRYLGFRHEEA